MGMVLMTVLTILVLAVSVVESRDRVRRDYAIDNAGLRSWYDARYGRRGREFNRDNLEHALRRAQNFRRWGPVTLSGGTLLVAVIVISAALGAVPELRAVWRTPERLLALIEGEVLVQTAVVLALLPILVVEGILAALYVADLDIGRLRRLLESLD